MVAQVALSLTSQHRPPMAPGWPLIHNMPELVSDPLSFFLKSYLTLGPAFQVRAPTRHYHVLAGPEANRWLVREGERYLDHQPAYRHVAKELHAKNYPIATHGARHKHLRQGMAQAFSRSAQERYVPAMLSTLRDEVAHWRDGRTMRVPAAMHRLSGNAVGMAMLGRPVGGLLDPAITFARFSVGTGLGSYPTFMAYMPHYQFARQRMNAAMHAIIAEHRAHPVGDDRPADFVDLLLGMTDHTGVPLDDADLIANAQMAYSNTLLYGAPAISFALYDLLKHPEALAKAQPEIDAFWSDGPQDFSRLSQMRYLRAAMRESFRINPIALATPRIVKEPFTFAGYHFDAGDVLLVTGTVCHFLPEIYPDPFAFKPERFLDAPSDDLKGIVSNSGMYVPFGQGGHACMGVGVVETMIMTVLATILHQWTLRLAPEDYTLRRVVNPFPEPERAFAMRVVARRAV